MTTKKEPKIFIVYNKYYCHNGMPYLRNAGIGEFGSRKCHDLRSTMEKIRSNVHAYGVHEWPKSKKEKHWERAAIRMGKKIPNKFFAFLSDLC